MEENQQEFRGFSIFRTWILAHYFVSEVSENLELYII